jgi:hypothetical protein
MDMLISHVNMRQLYSNALADRAPNGRLGNYNRGLGHKPTSAEIIYFAQHKVDYASVRGSKFGDGLLVSIVENDRVKAAFEKYAADCLVAGKEPTTSGRVAAHLARLTSPTRKIDVEITFGTALLRNLCAIEDALFERKGFPFAKNGSIIIDYDYGRHVIQGEGDGTVMFWTFAPYLYKALTERHQRTEVDAVMLVASWPFIQRQVVPFSCCYDNHLLGLMDLFRVYFLGYAPAGPSHEFTRLKAEAVAERLLQASSV